MVAGFRRAGLVLLGGAAVTFAAAACSGGDDGGGGKSSEEIGPETGGATGAGLACAQSDGCQGCRECFDLCVCRTEDVPACLSACGLGGGGTTATGGTAGSGGAGGDPGAGGAGGDPGTGGAAGDPGAGGAGGDPGAGGAGGLDGGGAGGDPGSGGGGGNGQQPPFTPVYRIALRVHIGQSQLLQNGELLEVLEEINWIWWSQAGICFEVETVDHDQTMSSGFDFWFRPVSGVNGYYSGDHDIHTKDYPSLSPSPNPTDHPAARTAAHELGHGLTLGHYNGYPDSSSSLMSSGTRGWALHDFEIQAARGRAAQKALSDTTPLYCGAPQIN